ncbi:collagen alpha-1(XXV) chain-like [Heptranchias perlo]|uniref:collagen alpha-1(XXV) chain-like n=1 Tax=Heptranchias perlo TaxID=212740 RepID=UPI00355A4094
MFANWLAVSGNMSKMSTELSSEQTEDQKQVEGAGATPSPGGWCCRTLSNALWFVLSVGSVAFCICLSVKTSQLEERIFVLEKVKGDTLPHPGPSASADRMRLFVQEKVDQLLSQRSYEDAGKRRTAREASYECNCPAGPPGKRGRRGRNGVPALGQAVTLSIMPLREIII